MDLPGGTDGGLTDRQYRLLRTAARRGYFEVPRQVSIVELADDHGISDREASEELRRGVDTVLEAVDLEDVRADGESDGSR